MTPKDEADTVRIVIGIVYDPANLSWCLPYRLVSDGNWNGRCSIECFSHFLGVHANLLQGFRTVQVLTSSYKPDLLMTKIE